MGGDYDSKLFLNSSWGVGLDWEDSVDRIVDWIKVKVQMKTELFLNSYFIIIIFCSTWDWIQFLIHVTQVLCFSAT
jgi:hypothetical protein